MSTGTNDTGERLRFRERYATMSEDDLVRLAMDENLIPAAREAMTEEVEARGLRDLSSFKKRFEEDSFVTEADRLSAFIPASALSQKGHRFLVLTILLMLGLLGVHKWLLGDATTWRNEEVLAVWLFLGLMLTWEPMVCVVKGQASGGLLFWLALVSLQFAMLAAVFAVPAFGRFVSGFNPPLAVTILSSPAILLLIDRIAKRIARRSR